VTLLRMTSSAHGVPFFLIELLRGLLEEGLVLQRHLCECVASSAVVAVAGLVLSSSSPGGPVPDVFGCVVCRSGR
jgi:hypothetical protein